MPTSPKPHPNSSEPKDWKAWREASIRQQQDYWAKLYESLNGKPMPDDLKGGTNLPRERSD